MTKNSDLAAKCNDVIAKYNDLSTKYTEQSCKYTDLSTIYNDLSTKYNTLLTTGNGLFFLVSTISYSLDRNAIFTNNMICISLLNYVALFIVKDHIVKVIQKISLVCFIRKDSKDLEI